jgi:hypothetical protein
MKLRILSIVVMILATTTVVTPKSSDLEGCLDANAIVTALAKLHDTDWKSLSLDQLRSIWPAELDGKDCTLGDAVTCGARIES